MKKERYLTDDELNRIRNEEDMLKGNINRMCICDDIKELEDMYNWATKRLFRIYRINLDKFVDNKESESKWLENTLL